MSRMLLIHSKKKSKKTKRNDARFERNLETENVSSETSQHRTFTRSRYLLERTKCFEYTSNEFDGLSDEEEISIIENSLRMNEALHTRDVSVRNNNSHRTHNPIGGLNYFRLAPRGANDNESLNFSKIRRAPNSLAVIERKYGKVRLADGSEFALPRTLECGYCLKYFFHKKLLRRHSLENHVRTLRCGGCGEPFEDSLKLRKHRRKCQRILF